MLRGCFEPAGALGQGSTNCDRTVSGRKQATCEDSCEGTGLKHERLLNCAHLTFEQAPVRTKANASKGLIWRAGASFPSQQDS